MPKPVLIEPVVRTLQSGTGATINRASGREAAAPEVFWLFHAVHDAMIAARNVVAKHRTMPGGDAAGAEQSAPQVLERLVEQAERAGASDIHLHMRAGSASVAFRLDGVMTPTADLPAAIAERVFGRIKFLARLKTYQESLPQDGRIDKAALKARTDIRVATYPTVTGEKIVLRLFDTTGIRPLAELGFPLRSDRNWSASCVKPPACCC